MSTAIDIGTLITRSPETHGSCPVVAGTGVTVRRIASDYKMGLSAEEIAAEIEHLTLAQVYAAIAYYHANKDEIEADLVFQTSEVERLEARTSSHPLLQFAGILSNEEATELQSVITQEFEQVDPHGW
ncbi:MAG TPA: DUF433 domain-containing protein [Allocoleopsis sp.]